MNEKALAVMALSILFLAGCLGQQYVDIKEIKDNPDKYVGKEVWIQGTVKDEAWYQGNVIGFIIEDDTGSITVPTNLPGTHDLMFEYPIGEKLRVNGKLYYDDKLGSYCFQGIGFDAGKEGLG